MAEAPLSSQIKGLLEIKEHRGLAGDQALWCWVVSALSILLKAEMGRIDKEARKGRDDA